MQVFLMALISAIFSPAIIQALMKSAGIVINSQDLVSGVGGAVANVATPAATPGAVAEPKKPPTAAQTINDSVNNPVSLFGIGFVGFVSVFVIAQMRAAGHEVTETSKDLYNAGRSATDSLSNADASTKNISRRMKN